MKDFLLRACIVVKTSNMENSLRCLADCVKTLHQKACRTIIFPRSTHQSLIWGVVVAAEVVISYIKLPNFSPSTAYPHHFPVRKWSNSLSFSCTEVE